MIPLCCRGVAAAGNFGRAASVVGCHRHKSCQNRRGFGRHVSRLYSQDDSTTHHRTRQDLGSVPPHDATLLPPQSRPSPRARAVLLVLLRPGCPAPRCGRARGLLDEHAFVRSRHRRPRGASPVRAGVPPIAGAHHQSPSRRGIEARRPRRSGACGPSTRSTTKRSRLGLRASAPCAFPSTPGGSLAISCLGCLLRRRQHRSDLSISYGMAPL